MVGHEGQYRVGQPRMVVEHESFIKQTGAGPSHRTLNEARIDGPVHGEHRKGHSGMRSDMADNLAKASSQGSRSGCLHRVGQVLDGMAEDD
eukprot:8065157-Karenia_brevis.AAC.1